MRLRPDADVAALERALTARFSSDSRRATYRLQALPRIHLYSKIDLEGFNGDSGMPYRDIRDLYPLTVLGLSILLIACTNFVNLATARSVTRAREIGLRQVVGAHRRQVVGQFLCESLLFTGLALPISLCLTRLMLPQFSALMGQPLAFNIADHMSWIAGIALITGLISGSYPAFYLSAQQPVDVLKGLRHRLPKDLCLRRGLVVAQFAVSAILIAFTLVVYQQMDLVQRRDLGFDREQIAVVKIFGPDAEQVHLNGQYNAVKQRFLRHPNIVAAGTSFDLPGTVGPSGVLHRHLRRPTARWKCAFFGRMKVFSRVTIFQYSRGKIFQRDMRSGQRIPKCSSTRQGPNDSVGPIPLGRRS